MEDNHNRDTRSFLFSINNYPENKIKRIIGLTEIEYNSRFIVDKALSEIELEVELNEEDSSNNIDVLRGRKYNNKIYNNSLKVYDLVTDVKKNFEEDFKEISGGSEIIKSLLGNIEVGDNVIITTKRRTLDVIVDSFDKNLLTVRKNDMRRLEFSFKQFTDGKVRIEKKQ